MITTMFRWKKMDMACLNKLASFLLYAMLVDFTLEALDFIQRLYESEESITILSDMISNRLFISLIVAQIILGSVAPLVGIILAKLGKVPDEMKRMLYFIAAALVQVGIFSTRWNVVVGGQLFSKSLRGLTVYKLELFGLEGLFMAVTLLIAPIVVLYILVKLFPPWMDKPELEVVADEVR
jgi:predicted membrane protein